MKTPTAKKLPSGQWFCRVRIHGEDIGITRPTEKAAVAEAMAIKAGIKKAAAKGERRTLEDIINAYIDNRRKIRSVSTIRGYIQIRNRIPKSLLGRRASDLSKSICQAEIRRMAAIYAPKTLNNTWSFICSCLREAGQETPALELPAKINRTRAFLDEEQIPIFIEAIKGEVAELGILFALHGLRLSEIMALTRKSVDLKRGIILVRGATVINEHNKPVYQEQNKNYTSTREVPILIPRLIELYNQVDSDPLIKLSRNTIYSTSKRCSIRAGLPEVGVHSLRHTFASLCYAKRIPAKITQQLGGWKDYQTVIKIYTHISKRNIAASVGELRTFFEEIET